MNYDAIAVPALGRSATAEKATPATAGRGEKRRAPEPPTDKPAQRDVPNPAPSSSTEEAVRRLVDNGGRGGEPSAHARDASADAEFTRRRLILKLKAYATSFPDVAGELLKSKDLEAMDTRSLEILLNEVKFVVGAKTSSIVTGTLSGSALTIGQHLIAENTGLLVNGPRITLDAISNSKDYQDLVKELTLEYADWVYTSPVNRMMAYMAHSVMTIHNVNKVYKEKEGEQGPAKRQRTESEPEAAPAARPSPEVVVLAAEDAPPGRPAAPVAKGPDGFELPTTSPVPPGATPQKPPQAPPKPAPRPPPGNPGRGR